MSAKFIEYRKTLQPPAKVEFHIQEFQVVSIYGLVDKFAARAGLDSDGPTPAEAGKARSHAHLNT